MAKAANQLAVSVPVVSKPISDLEHSVGVQLLDRKPQGVEPTAYGRALLHRSAIAFEELRQGVKDIEFLADPTVGEVRIGQHRHARGELRFRRHRSAVAALSADRVSRRRRRHQQMAQ